MWASGLSVPAVHLNQQTTSMPRNHIIERGRKIGPWNKQDNELTYLRFLHVIAE